MLYAIRYMLYNVHYMLYAVYCMLYTISSEYRAEGNAVRFLVSIVQGEALCVFIILLHTRVAERECSVFVY